MIITKDELNELIKELAREEKIFLCEAQFQFELAWKLREHFEKQKREVGIHLEFPNRKEYKKEANPDEQNCEDEKHRLYYDIVLEKDNTYCVIELKYKTKKEKVEYLDRTIELKDQSAQNLGRYDFIKDISRIENFSNDNDDLKLDCGYAILVTNDHTYWSEEGNGCMYENFALKNDIVAGTKEWKKVKGHEANKKSVGKLRLSSIDIRNSYKVNWSKYKDNFYYLLIDISTI